MTKSTSILSAKEVSIRALRFTPGTTGKWNGGPNFIFCSKFGSKGSNSKFSRGRSKYSCGTERAYLGDIQKSLAASWAARRGHK
jgi:hypothetical protein